MRKQFYSKVFNYHGKCVHFLHSIIATVGDPVSKQFYRNIYVCVFLTFNNHLSYPPHLESGILVGVPHWLELPEEHMFPSTLFASSFFLFTVYVCTNSDLKLSNVASWCLQ